MSNYQSFCELHPGTDFPVRVDPRDASEDRNHHMRTPGSHIVDTHPTDEAPREAAGFPPAGSAARLESDISEALEHMKSHAVRQGGKA